MCPFSKVNDARKYLLTKRGRDLEGLPPTRDALEQHVKRATYQGGHVWGQSTVLMPQLPHPEGWGWTSTEETWQPRWCTLPEAAISCQELVRCGCKTNCRNNRCKCCRANLPCTSLCVCDGRCIRE